MAQLTKPASSNASARGLFAGGAEAPTPTASGGNPGKASAKSASSGSPVNFEQTISAAVSKSAPSPTDKAATSITESPNQHQERDQAAPRPDAAGTSSPKSATTSSVKPQEDEKGQAVTVETQTQLLSLLEATAASTSSEDPEMDSPDTDIPTTDTQTASGSAPSSDLALYLAAGPSTSMAVPPVPPPANSGTAANDSLSISSSTAKSGAASTSASSPVEQMASANSSQPPVETRQNGIIAAADRPILPSSDVVSETETEPLSSANPSLVPTNTEPVGLEGKSHLTSNPEATPIARQTEADTPIRSAVTGKSQEVSTSLPPPPPASPNDAGTGEELLSRFQIAARGTSVASGGEVMKPTTSFAPALPASQAGMSQEKVAGSASGGESSLSLAQLPRPDADLDQPKDSNSGSDREDSRASSVDRLQAPSLATAGTTTDSLEEVARPTDLQSIEMLRNEILTRVVEFGDENPTSMTVVLRPDQGTELTIHLKSQDGRIEVQVRLEKGNDQAYRSSWESLQQSLSQRGVNLASLQSASIPILSTSAPLLEIRNEAGGTISNLRAIEATVAAAGASNPQAGSEQREPGSRDSRSPNQEAGWDSGDERRGRDQAFSFDDRNLGGESRPEGTSPVWINPSRRGALLASEAIGTTSLIPAGSETSPPAPWESWA